MSRFGFWIFICLTLWPKPAFGQRSCLPSSTALQVIETVVPEKSGHFTYNLMSDRGGTLAKTKVQVTGSYSASSSREVKFTIGFDPQFQGVSLPYNLYAMMIIRDGEVIGWWDFTLGCTEPGLSFFPGREIELPAAKLIGDKPQKLQIMVWGRL